MQQDQKNKCWFVGVMFFILLLVIGGGMTFGYWMDMKSDEYNFCIDVYHKNITDDPQIVSYCKKLIEDQKREWAQEETERNERMLKKLQESN